MTKGMKAKNGGEGWPVSAAKKRATSQFMWVRNPWNKTNTFPFYLHTISQKIALKMFSYYFMN